MDATALQVMAYCNNYHARLYEHAASCEAVGASVTCGSGWEGKYRPGDFLRIHGSYNASYAGIDAGECYEVVSFDGVTLVLDHELHTRAGYLTVVYCEPPREFLDLCAEIGEFNAKTGKSRGLQSESIDGYSWSAGQGGLTFGAAFADRLKQYRQPAPTRLYYAREAERWR